MMTPVLQRIWMSQSQKKHRLLLQILLENFCSSQKVGGEEASRVENKVCRRSTSESVRLIRVKWYINSSVCIKRTPGHDSSSPLDFQEDFYLCIEVSKIENLFSKKILFSVVYLLISQTTCVLIQSLLRVWKHPQASLDLLVANLMPICIWVNFDHHFASGEQVKKIP